MSIIAIIERTQNMCNIYKAVIALNPSRFQGKTPAETAKELIELVGIEPDTINTTHLENFIESKTTH